MHFSEKDGGAVIEFNCRFRSRPTDSAAERIIETIAETDEKEKQLVRLFAYIAACTRSVVFKLNGELPTDAWEQLEKYWQWLEVHFYVMGGEESPSMGVTTDATIIRSAWNLWDEMVAPAIQENWSTAFTKAQQVLPGKRHLLPNDLLTVEELTDPNFLALRKTS